MANARRIQDAIERVHDQESFAQELLIDALEWPLEEDAASIQDVAYKWNKEELRAVDLTDTIVDGKAHEIVLPGSPWGVFILEFKNPDVLTTGRGMTGILRRVLNGLVQKKRTTDRDPRLAAFKRENLLFICNHEYKHYRFAHFKAPPEASSTPRMASFGWGPDDLQAVRTICEFNLSCLNWPDHAPVNDDEWTAAWGSAFDVEKVTKRFYQDYAAVFAKVEALIGNQKALKGDELRLFTQSLFNRLMFLRFIERKSWLTFPGQSDSRYLAALEAAGGVGKRSFYQSRISPLFFEGLAQDGKQNSDIYGTVPLLNGGLFEQSDLDTKVGDLPDEAFKPIISADGLFYRYNFTVEESTPLDIEVAVDPEMLGKVFEELVTGRHESGSYYTPRPVVAFMCREALKGHLTGHTKASEDAIAALVDRHEIAPGLTDTHAREIVAALDDLKAIDPACGSGAYLLGLLQEVVAIYRLLYSEKLTRDARSLYDLKLRIISNNLYGVDVDPFATNIAMLRLWLSLSVEADEPVALPNLDFKIETGDALLGPCEPIADSLQAESLRRQAIELVDLKDDFLRCRKPRKKAELKAQIEAIEARLAFVTRHLRGKGVIDWYIHFAEVFGRDAKSPENNGFDIVLANPPYVRQELIKDIKPKLKSVYRTEYVGTADLYVFFYLRALQLLTRGGMLVFISSNKWFRAAYGKKLRALFGTSAMVHTIVDFHDLPVFESAIAYPMIFVAQNAVPTEGHVATLVEAPSLDPPYPDVLAVVQKYGEPLPPTATGGDGTWHLASASDSDRLMKMRAAGPSLGEYVQGRLFRGLLTGLNEAWVDSNGRIYTKGQIRPTDAVRHGVLVIDGVQRQELVEAEPRSAEVIKPLATGRDINRWQNDELRKWMIVIEIGTDINRYPAVYEHLRRFQSALEVRRDQGNHWWELRACAYYRSFDSPKIMYPVITQRPTFALDVNGCYCNDKCYFIESSDLFLLAVLNSSAFWEFVSGTCSPLQNGFFEMRKTSLEQFPIPDATEADIAAIAALAQKCLDTKGVDCEAWEKEIDERVAALYGL
jgi:hypothetical protein